MVCALVSCHAVVRYRLYRVTCQEHDVLEFVGEVEFLGRFTPTLGSGCPFEEMRCT